jgi:hypothetical protein
MSLAQKWKEIVRKANENGIPLPMARDPKTKVGSVSLTMVVTSFGLMAFCTTMAIALVVNKWAGFFTDEANALASLKEAFFMAFQMATLSCGLYWGRKFQRDEKGAVSIEGEQK